MAKLDLLYLGLYCFFLIDWAMTYLTLKWIRKEYPKMDYRKMELNKVAQHIWGKFGFEKGSFILLGVITCVWLIMYFAFMRGNIFMFWYMLGVYTIVFMVHISNLINQKRKEAWFHDMYMKAYKELPFKEDRISDLLAERDAGKWGGNIEKEKQH